MNYLRRRRIVKEEVADYLKISSKHLKWNKDGVLCFKKDNEPITIVQPIPKPKQPSFLKKLPCDHYPAAL